MNWPIDCEGRSRVNGFAVLDEDFDFMLADCCCELREQPDEDRVRRMLGSNRTNCLDPVARLYPL